MNISADTVKLKSHVSLLYEEKRLTKQLQELCHNCYLEAQTNLVGDSTVFWKQQQFFEKQLSNIEQRIVILEKTIEKFERYATSTEEQLNESAQQLKSASEDTDL